MWHLKVGVSVVSKVFVLFGTHLFDAQEELVHSLGLPCVDVGTVRQVELGEERGNSLADVSTGLCQEGLEQLECEIEVHSMINCSANRLLRVEPIHHHETHLAKRQEIVRAFKLVR